MQTRYWKVISHAGGAAGYSWRCVDVGRLTVEISTLFASYGDAMLDAIRHGFGPSTDCWTRITENYTTHFAPGKAPVIVAAGRTDATRRKLRTEE
jgi:hypothetical protein